MMLLYFSGTELSGYITVEAYIKSCVPKLTKWLISRYFVVNEAIARIGDAVDAGTLTSGSSKVFAG